jgi:hypothetical protein
MGSDVSPQKDKKIKRTKTYQQYNTNPNLDKKSKNNNLDKQKEHIINQNPNIINQKSSIINKQNEIKNINIKSTEASHSSSNITKKRDYKCTYDKNELFKKLNNYLIQPDIQNQSFAKKNDFQDPVFDLIQNEEKNLLTKFYNKNKDGFLNEILYYLNS